ncbi:type II secretion system secretin GspD [Bradyrhizobium sp.]|uniref:type II secretion system secretin GspD n=1 Tax=Bradyrhizobium sp. TaxID=376 RepID=UPI001EB42659|nr:type II secretion system secretin GspD [Bradyrhizobium sp.]MBV9981186.1 type II secretion system secretin GspD [Bradyrhizobium sp.]
MAKTAHRIGFFVRFLVPALLAACNTISGVTDLDTAREPDVLDRVRSVDLLPRAPSQVQQTELSTGRRAKPIIYRAEPADDPAQTASIRQMAQPVARGDSFELNFENVAVASVAKVVLGDILGVGYVIDPRVQGTISLSSARPIPKSDIPFALENALRVSGIALVRDNAAYRLMPQADAVGTGAADTPESTEAGYGVSVVPLQYVSAQMLLKLVENFGTKAGMLRADNSRNLILVQGTGTERRTAVDLLLSFDVDWMRGQSVGIFPVENANPEPIIAELEKIIDSGEGGVTQHMVRLQPIGRMNAVLAVTRKPDMLRRIETWINRLDNTNNARSSIHVYNVKYGEARQIARALNDIFGGSGSSGALDGDTGQIAPGSGISSSSSGSALSRLSAGQSGQMSGGSGSARLASSSSTGGTGNDTTQAGYNAASNAAPQGASLFDNPGGAPSSGPRGGAAVGGVLEGVRITADTVNNTLLIYASQEQYSIVERTLRQIDRPQRQVAIEATIAEVTLTDDLQFGVQSYLTSGDFGLKPDTGSFGNSAASAVVNAAGNVVLSRVIPGFNFLVGSGVTPKGILNALHAVTDVRVLSNPSLVVIDNEVASLQVGNEIPIQTGSATVLTGNNTVASTTDYRSTGIILRVVPRINANGNVRLDVEQEISNPLPATSAQTTSNNPLTPTVSTRKVRSSIAVASGQTVLLAGLISDNQNRTRNGIPGLDQIPGLGDVFAQSDKNIQRTELIIFIRPQIIRDGTDAHFVAEEVRAKLRGTIGTVESRQTAPSKYR